MTEKTKVILILSFTVLLITACNLPFIGKNNSTPTSQPGELATEALETTLETDVAESGEPPAPANTDGAETILIPGATFWMGSEESDTVANIDEFPYHQVTLSGFYIYTNEVTNAMYARCVEAGVCLPIFVYESGPTTHSDDPEYADNPVVGVDWLMAEDYCTWAGGRLPTEAEWELASRGVDSLTYPWGNDEPTCDRVNMLGCTVPADTVAVGSYADGNSSFEVWDLSGNVWEWVNDWYDESYYSLSSTSNPIGPYYGDYKVARGGGLYSEPLKMRSAERAAVDPHMAYDDVGFRCVPVQAALPEEYFAPEEIHERVLPDPLDGGGERLEDPEGVPPGPPGSGEDPRRSITIGQAHVSCPDSDGMITLFVRADSSEEVEYSVFVNGVLFECEYNEVAGGLDCTGPVPEDYESLHSYTVEVHFGTLGIVSVPAYRPLDCPADMEFPSVQDFSVGCPDDMGLVRMDFHYEPAINWESTRYMGTLIDCEMVSPNDSNCVISGFEPGHTFTLDWVGTYVETGMPTSMMTTVTVPADCVMKLLNVNPFCFEGHPTAQVNYLPPDDILETVVNAGNYLDCIGMAPGVQVCGDLTDPVGATTSVGVDFEGQEVQWFDIEVPDCQSTQTVEGFSISPGCYETLGPVVVIEYVPSDLPLVSATADGTSLSCYDAPTPGYYMCSGIPGEAGDTTNISFCLSDGTCHDGDVPIMDCTEDTGPVGFWNLAGVHCFHESGIYMIIDTPFSELVAGSSYTATARTIDNLVLYDCAVHPTMAGRLYCYGNAPVAISPLEVCVTLEGEAEQCSSFDDFSSRIPNCDVVITEEPDEPDPVVPVDCSVYTNYSSCMAVPECIFVKSCEHR